MSKKLDEALDADIQADRENRDLSNTSRLRSDLREARARISALEQELETAERRLDLALKLDKPPRKSSEIVSNVKVKPGAHRGAFVLLCSDWHIGERVDPEQVGGRNEYNPDIASKRVDGLIRGAKWMLESLRSGDRGYGWSLDHVVLWLGGDIMTGFLHEDQRESNYLTPTQEVLLAQELCIRLIDEFLAHPGVARLTIVTSFGNHGRTTPERRVATAWKMSYEYMLYKLLERHYRREARIDWHVSVDEFCRVDVLNTRLRFNHGDTFRYADGVGGLTIPARKWLAKLDKTEPADVTCVGHWHQYLDIGDLVVNGCLIGWGAYAQRVAPYTPPSQVCFLVDERVGKRLSTEIFVD